MGRETLINRGNGTTTTSTYNGTSLSWTLAQDVAGTAQDVQFDLSFTPAPQLHARTISNSSYAYGTTASTTNYSPNGLNQYAAVGGTGFSYDGRGNLTSDNSRSMAYDLENHLTSVSGSAAMTLAYDPKGRLHQTDASSSTVLLYDGDSLVEELDTGGNILRRYVPGNSVDDTLVWYEGSSLGAPNMLYTDEQGSVIATANSSSTSQYIYSPTGEPTSWSGARFRYTGQAALPAIALYYYKARMYDPHLGRFLQTDPVGYSADYNLYEYAGNDPINGSDPSGRDCTSSNGTTTCITDFYKVSFPQQSGFKDFTTNSANYHFYSVPVSTPNSSLADDIWYLINSPTPGFPSSASPTGTANDATPGIGGVSVYKVSPVKSFVLTNQKDGQPVVVNVTLHLHPLSSGVVVREPAKTASGNVIQNWGEGISALQSPKSTVGKVLGSEIDSVWKGRLPGSRLPPRGGCTKGTGPQCGD